MSERRGRSASSDAGPDTYTGHAVNNEHNTTQMESHLPELSHLKTKAESRALSATVQAWTVELPISAANSVLLLIKESIPDQDSIDLQHLRRFAKPTALPYHLQPPGSRSSSADSAASSNGSNSNTKSKSRSRSRMRKRRSSFSRFMHLLVCPVSVISSEDLTSLLLANPPFSEDAASLKVREVTVPLLAPTSQEQAVQWTRQYWPCMYRKTNPFGPHPSLIARAEEELAIDDNVAAFMAVARQAAQESKRQNLGISSGCMIIERGEDNQCHQVAIAGDARCCGLAKGTTESAPVYGNVAAHAVMRAIGMVARKRARVAAPKPNSVNAAATTDLLVQPVKHTANSPESVADSLLDYPLTDIERAVFEKDNIVADGYLCVDLEIYITHEPCLMCSMAIVHSRFARCIFGHRMPASGGLVADAGMGYGLFYRNELNWKLLCWEWKDAQTEQQREIEETAQV